MALKEDQTYIKNMFGLFLYFSERKNLYRKIQIKRGSGIYDKGTI